MSEENIVKKIREERLDYREIHFRLLDDFFCGVDSLDNYLKSEAYEHNYTGEGNTFLLFKDDSDIIIGYYTLRASSIKVESDYYPVVEISRLAIAKDFQRMGIGTTVVLTLINQKILQVFKYIGIKGVLVFSDSNAIDFYEKKIGFNNLGEDFVEKIEDGFSDDCTAMIMKIDKKFINSSSDAYKFAVENEIIEIKKNGIEIECPNCKKKIKVKSSTKVCPKCKTKIEINFKS